MTRGHALGPSSGRAAKSRPGPVSRPGPAPTAGRSGSPAAIRSTASTGAKAAAGHHAPDVALELAESAQKERPRPARVATLVCVYRLSRVPRVGRLGPDLAASSARRGKEVWRPAWAAAVWHVPPTMHTSVPRAPGETAVTTAGAVRVGRVEVVTHTQHLIAVVSTAVCWGAFGLTWVGGALYNASRGPRQSTRAPLGRFAIVVVIAGAIFFAIFRAVPTHTWRSLELQSPWGTGIGLVILLGSTVFTLWARFALGMMWTLDAVVKEGHALRTDGPYRITRHPIYTGILGMLLGSLLLAGVGRSLLLLPVALVLFEIKLHVEEELMLATFPDEYPHYRQRVPQLIPGLRMRRVGAERTQTPGGGRPSG